MKKAMESVLHTLSERGYRITKPRKLVIGALLEAREPISISSVSDILAVDEVSVYRTIEMLLAEEIIEEIRLQGKRPRYALMHGHHHHVACHGCGYVAHIPCDNTVSIPKKVPGFSSIQTHEVTYYGLCMRCA